MYHNSTATWISFSPSYPSDQTLWCSSDVPVQNRDYHFVAPFQDEDTNRFLVSTKRILGTGVTLTRAFRSVNMDADWEENWDIQCDGRHDRVIQKIKKTYTYYMVLDEEKSLEYKVLDVKARSEMLRELAYANEVDQWSLTIRPRWSFSDRLSLCLTFGDRG